MTLSCYDANTLDLRLLSKPERIQRARTHTEIMERCYSEWIEHSYKRSMIWTESDFDNLMYEAGMNHGREGSIYVTSLSSVDQIFATHLPNRKIAVLNFASFKHPGGMFFEGSSAQEESLCHSSYLYNVLRKFENTYYKRHLDVLNHGLYKSEVLYTKDVTFMQYINKGFMDKIYDMYYEDLADMAYGIDVITCAAPNAGTYYKYYEKADPRSVENELRDRIAMILATASINHVDTLILGAFGCGVFRNDPQLVAEIFKEYLTGYFEDTFKEVYFPIPKGRDNNYEVFMEVFGQ